MEEKNHARFFQNRQCEYFPCHKGVREEDFRHGQTQGNLEQRYISCRTDEPLCAQGKDALVGKPHSAVRRVFVSPMKRCIETVRLIYPQIEPEVIVDFRECDFGAFETNLTQN